MNRIGTRVRAFAAAMLLFVALPSVAADKLFTLDAKVYTTSGASTGGTIPAGGTSWLVLDFANQSPTGANSVIKSVRVTIPADITYALYQGKTVNNGTCPVPNLPQAVPTPSTTGGLLVLDGLVGVKTTGHFCIYLAVKTSLTTCTAVTWKGEANTGSNFGGGQPFYDFNDQTQSYSNATTNNGCTGILGCGATPGDNLGGYYGSVVLSESGYEGRADWGLVRGNNWNGETCTLVPYQFNFNSTTRTASFIPGTKGTQQISAEYVVVFDPIPYATAAALGWPNFRPELAWATTVPFAGVTPGSGDYVPALACRDDDVNGTDVLPTIPNTPPFNDGTYPAAQYPQYQVGQPAYMCIANMGWTAIMNPAGFPAGPYIQPWLKVIDRSDGYVRFP